MPLKQKHFVPFMISVGIAFTLWIIYTSFDYSKDLTQNFREEIAVNDTLSTWNFSVLGNEQQKVNVKQLINEQNKSLVLVFSASWSEKSLQLIDELSDLDILVMAAFVKDLESDALQSLAKWDGKEHVIGVDGMGMYNQMRAPGIPTSIIFDRKARFVDVAIGAASKSFIVDHLGLN